MRSRKLGVLSLSLKDVLNTEFVKCVIERKMEVDETKPLASSLCSARAITMARTKVLDAFETTKPDALLADLTALTPSELKGMAKLGNTSLRWIEGYLYLLGVGLSGSRSGNGMSKAAKDFLSKL